ncbi:MAG TPA: M1 family aminopeptidase, partial [Vicinamibacteria bacterium]|nr:M1 family aminopeptidase [Vicinamibacteria bacterium]
SQFAAVRFAADEVLLQVRGTRLEGPGGALALPAQIFSVSEPRARVEEALFVLGRDGEGWAITAREERPGIDGLMHLTLAPQPYRAAGLQLRFEDFELDLQSGSLFTSPPSLGPTVVVFVGRGLARFRPRPEEEREQLRQFSGRRELTERVSSLFVRLHPADFHRVFAPARLEPDPEGASRLREAQKVFAANVSSSFVLDAALPRSPWWLLPALGEASVAFRSRLGTLTYTLSSADPEGISLFDRERRRQICLYPREGRSTDYNEDQQRAVDVLEHDLTVRFEPQRFALQAEDTLKVRLDMATPTLRLRLHEDFKVESVRSREGGEHLFFRIRHQDGVLVSLGALSGRIGEVTLTVRYGGVHQPAPVERELQRAVVDSDRSRDEDVVIEPATVYSNRTAWYPQFNADDYATARLRLDLPEEYLALTGGRRIGPSRSGGRTQVEFVQDQPAKYITVAVGRFAEAGARAVGGVAVEAFATSRTRRGAAQALERAAAILPFFEQQFGPLPYRTLRLLVVEGLVPGGHSPPGMVMVVERPPLVRSTLRADPAGFWDVPGFFFAHELAHQWWGHGVAGQNYRERWISEAFAQYAAALWVRQDLGEVRFRQVLDRMGEWALRFSGEGPIHLGYRLGHVRGNPQVYRAVVYDKGAYVLHMVARLVGEDAFRTALRAVQQEFRFRKLGTHDLRAALEKASGKDL